VAGLASFLAFRLFQSQLDTMFSAWQSRKKVRQMATLNSQIVFAMVHWFSALYFLQ
jgi:hypothetical protein